MEGARLLVRVDCKWMMDLKKLETSNRLKDWTQLVQLFFMKCKIVKKIKDV